MKIKRKFSIRTVSLQTKNSESIVKVNYQRSNFISLSLCLLALVASIPWVQAQTIVPNNPSGTIINNAYPGVRFSNPVNGGNVYANNGYFYTSPGGFVLFPSIVANTGAVEASFPTPQSSVSINATPVGVFEYLGPNPENDPFLEAFSGTNATGTFLGQVVLPPGDMPNIVGGYGPTYTLTFTSGSANIGSVIFSEQAVTAGQYPNCYTGEFNELSYNNNLSGNNPTGEYPPITPYFKKPAILSDRAFQGSFNYYPSADIRVLMTTNIEKPFLTNSPLLGSVTEVSPGQYQFTDLQATNSSQRFYRLLAQSGIYIGNSLTVTNGGSDGAPPLVILGEYSSAGPLATSTTTLPTGTVEDVKFYGGNYNFTLYALSYVSAGSNPNEQKFKVVASESFSGSAPTGIQTLPVTGFSVSAGNLLAFAGTGPFYSENPNDALNSDATYENSSNPGSFTATPPAGSGTIFTVGLYTDPSANYEYIPDSFGNQGRDYGIGVDVSQ